MYHSAMNVMLEVSIAYLAFWTVHHVFLIARVKCFVKGILE